MLKSRSNWKRNLFIICALIPPMLVSMGLVMYPMISTVIRSFKNPETGELTFSNYVYLFTNKVSSAAIWYTLVISILTVLLAAVLLCAAACCTVGKPAIASARAPPT